MVLAAYRDNLYDFFLLLHILAVIVAFAPASAHPLTINRVRPDGEGPLARYAAAMSSNTRTVYLPALIVAGVLGFVLVLLSDEVWEFGDPWVGAAMLVWVILAGIVSGLILPGERAMAAGDSSAERRVALGGQLASVALVVMLWLMIFKPGA